MFDNVTVVSRPLVLSTPAEVDAAETRIGTRFPSGYREYVTQLGEGVLAGFIRIYPPRRILTGDNNVDEWRQRIERYWFWDAPTKETALEAVVIGDTLEGDELIFHPANPDLIYVLPRQSEEIYEAGDGVRAAIEWVSTSGALTEPLLDRNFEPFNNSQARQLGKATDDAGWTRGAILGGSGGKDNVWPQNLTSYRGPLREFERRIADHVRSTGQPVKFKQTFNYGNGGTRPTDFDYYVFDGNGNTLFQNNFKNP